MGKSSLLNALVGEQTAVVTPMAGTTRGAIRGFVGDFEIIDTPGMHKHASLLGKHMRKSISGAVQNADVLLYVLDAVRFNAGDVQKVENYRDRCGKGGEQALVIAVNKADMMKMEGLYPKLAMLQKLDFARAIVPVSAKTGFNIGALEEELAKIGGGAGASEADEEEEFTDQSVREMAGEILRGAVIRNTRAEIPHGVAVVVTEFVEKAGAVEIRADILCEKAAHKPILIGASGAMLKRIGTAARKDIEKMLGDGRVVRLYTRVVVRPDWKNDAEVVGIE